MLRRSVPVLAVCLAACSGGWPPPGSGGAADLQPERARAAPIALTSRDSLLSCSLARFRALEVASAARGQRTGEVYLESLDLNEARRESAGGLRRDADHTLANLDQELTSTATGLGARTDIPPSCT